MKHAKIIKDLSFDEIQANNMDIEA